jgi:hypothetical protein
MCIEPDFLKTASPFSGAWVGALTQRDTAVQGASVAAGPHDAPVAATSSTSPDLSEVWDYLGTH